MSWTTFLQHLGTKSTYMNNCITDGQWLKDASNVNVTVQSVVCSHILLSELQLVQTSKRPSDICASQLRKPDESFNDICVTSYNIYHNIFICWLRSSPGFNSYNARYNDTFYTLWKWHQLKRSVRTEVRIYLKYLKTAYLNPRS